MSASDTDASAGDKAGLRNPVARGIAATLATLVPLGSLGWAADLYRSVLGMVFTTQQFLAAILALALPVLFLTFRALPRMRKDRVPWYDWVFAALGFASALYVAVRHTVLSELASERPLDGMIVASVLVVVVLEGLRRTTGWALFSIVIVFLAYSQVADLMPAKLQALTTTADQAIYYVAWDTESMLGLPTKVACVVVIAFIFFGNLLSRSGGSSFFTDLAVSLMGRFRGGSAKIAVVASGLFGSISGSAVSNVVSTGVITIPLMRQGGFSARFAAAIESVASTGGQLMPPIMGAAAFLLATFVEETYGTVILAALVPAILYYVALFIQVDLVAAKNGIKAVDESLIPRVLRVLKMGWHYPLAFAVLIGSLFWLNVQPETAALYASATIFVTGVLFGYDGKRMPVNAVYDALKRTGVASVDILMICAAAGIIIGILNLTGFSYALANVLVDLAGGNLYLLLLLAAIICIILGMGMPTAGVYVLLATLVAPSIEAAGVDKMAAHLYVMYFGMMSMITPPVAIAAFTAASLAKTNPMATGFAAVRFGWIAYVVPVLFVLSPSLLLQGSTQSIVLAVVTAVAGVGLICAAVTGYLFRPMDIATRIATGAAGLAMLVPANAVQQGHWVDLAGVALAVVLVTREFLLRRSVASTEIAAGG
ncbi:MAG: TRAP transporter fused permease subunit [Alphaproteobacteria bacterium]